VIIFLNKTKKRQFWLYGAVADLISQYQQQQYLRTEKNISWQATRTANPLNQAAFDNCH